MFTLLIRVAKQDEVTDVKHLAPDFVLLVAQQLLLVEGGSSCRHISFLVQSVQVVLWLQLGLLLLILVYLRSVLHEVTCEDSLNTVYHEEWRVASKAVGGCPQTSQHGVEFLNPLCIGLFQRPD